jgi:hypothetical protein
MFGDALEDGGRGLTLVQAMSRSWGVEDDAAGRVVWFEIEPMHETTESAGGTL